MDRERVLAEVTPDVAAALTCLEARGFAAPWREVAMHVAIRIGQALRFSEGEGGISVPIRNLLLDRYGASSPAVRALWSVLPTNRRWSATILAPIICAYLDIPNAETLRQSMPPGDSPG
jgi:hypothetical protein